MFELRLEGWEEVSCIKGSKGPLQGEVGVCSKALGLQPLLPEWWPSFSSLGLMQKVLTACPSFMLAPLYSYAT